LMQSFLVGQPEFREILQRPEMEQFRQRVAATCHIGPLDTDETQHYIEHRLKCAGSTGKPGFDADAFEAIFKASNGIPRRINSICDRLLLLGFLAGKTQLSRADVEEVMRDMAQESSIPAASPAPARPVPGAVGSAGTDVVVELDLDLSQLKLDTEAAGAMTRQLASLTAEHRGAPTCRSCSCCSSWWAP
jgi:general secretion pathway protein A